MYVALGYTKTFLYTVEITLNNPFDGSAKLTKADTELLKGISPKYKAFIEKGGWWPERHDLMKSLDYEFKIAHDMEQAKALTSALLQAGYDGAIIPQIDNDTGKQIKEYVVFDPAAIKILKIDDIRG